MIDINNIISLALTSAINKAIEPLVERIEKLETNCTAYEILHKNQHDALVALRDRITALEGDVSHTVQVQQANIVAALADRIAALESGPSAIVEEQRGIDDELMRVKQRVEALESENQGENRYLNRDEVNELIAEAMDDHLGTYDHDEYDNHLGDDDKHFDGDIEDAVRNAINGTSVTLSF